MITNKKIGTHGRLGNQLFQIASLIGIGHKETTIAIDKNWKYHQYFTGNYPINDIPSEYNNYKEPSFHYNKFPKELFSQDINLDGYFQSERYFEQCRNKIKSSFTFKPEFIQHCREKINPYTFGKTTIAIHIRRGDYLDNPNYENLTLHYYINALHDEFPNWRTMNLVIFSDDIEYAKLHFGCLANVFFSEGNSDIEDLCLMSQCDNFIIANSSYSWWGAYLSELNNTNANKWTKIVRPVYHFKGKLKETCNIKDFYPERWTSYDHKDKHGSFKKFPLKDLTFTIPVAFDHHDRKKNLDLNVCLLQYYFETNIMVDECNGNQFNYMKKFGVRYYEFFSSKFHRTRMLNFMAEQASTKFIANWDADVILPPMQIIQSYYALQNSIDMVYPYDGRFARVPRQAWFVLLEKSLDIGILAGQYFKGMENECKGMSTGDDVHYHGKVSVGGAVFWNRKKFLEGGGENEKFISFAPEDTERIIRFKKLGYRVYRVSGCLYHINHWIGVNSSVKHEDYPENKREFDKVNTMTKEELLNYIKTWK